MTNIYIILPSSYYRIFDSHNEKMKGQPLSSKKCFYYKKTIS